jgi:AcrR family transcriptional regulator
LIKTGAAMMDLRIVKTKRNIRQAFIELRSKNALEKVKVKELCELALINKTTFYKHYQDIFDLSDEIENETVLSIMSTCEHIDSLFTDPDRFIRGLFNTFKAHEEIIMILFPDRMNVLFDKVQGHLITHYPSFSGTPEKEIILSFLLKGSSHVLMDPNFDELVSLDTLSKVTKQIIKIIDENQIAFKRQDQVI